MSLADSSAPGGITAAALNQSALLSLRRGDVREARATLEAAVQMDPTLVSSQLNLAAACRALDDLPAAMTAVEAALKSDPRSFMALLMKASLLERQGQTRLAGAAYGLALNQAPPLDRVDAPTRKALERAKAATAAYSEDLSDFLSTALAAKTDSQPSSPERDRLAAFVDRLAGRRRIYHQQPMQFAYPGLPSIEFYDRSFFPWLAQIEAATPEVRSELLALVAEEEAGQGGFTPYVEYPEGVPLDQWAELNHSPRWSAYHLYKGGEPQAANCAKCPRTLAALRVAPQPHTRSRSPAAMFSLLKPRTRIPPHTGVSNTRLVVHLPLVTPEGCGFRVGSETRAWRVGQAWVFDDTIEHEAWNDSDDWRAILIFDVWSPFLSEGERRAVTEVMHALDAFHGVAGEAAL
jgi:aspartyl/asparaginyl beta-hydroxylase (cupin superfamily)